MSLDTSLDDLKSDAEALARYYSKDFGNHLTGIQASAEVYLYDPDNRRKKSIEDSLELINGFYGDIPFSSLPNDDRYAPLIVINHLLPEVNGKMRKFFEDTNRQTFEEFFSICSTIHHVGHLYRDSFHKALENVRAHPDGIDFTIRLTGLTGKVWDY